MRTAAAAGMAFIGTLVMMMLSSAAGPVSAIEDTQTMEGTYYCYGDNPELVYPYELPSNVQIHWSAEALDGTPVPCVPSTGTRTIIDLSGLSGTVRVTQTMTDGTTTKTGTINVIPLHIGDSKYTVRFFDGSKVLNEQTIDHTTVTREGGYFFYIPAEPVKEGYTFEGWYVGDTSVKAEAVAKSPVTEDLDIYAKWSGSGSGGPSYIIIDKTVTVTFDTVAGIEYTVLSSGAGVVTFTVNQVGGFDMRMETLKVTVGEQVIVPSNNVYIVTGIVQSTVIEISCERNEPSPEPSGGSDSPWWIPIVAGLVVVILVLVAALCRERSRNRD